MAEIAWTKIEGVSLASSARQAGFDLAVYDSYSEATQAELKKRAIKNALHDLSGRYEERTGRSLAAIDRGVYVISVGWPFAVQYPGKRSDVIYIGIGRVLGRLDSHFKYSLFDLMESLQGVDFTFFVSEPRLQKVDDYYKHVEYLMLEGFRKTIGGGRQYPLLNKNAGAKRKVNIDRKGWKLPLKNTGKTPRWLIQPTHHNEFARLD